MIYKGLSSKKVKILRQQYGYNALPIEEEPFLLHILWSQVKNPLTYILVLVGAISLIMSEYINASLVLLVTLLNVTIGFFQEYSAQKTLVALRAFLKPLATVIRDGQKQEIEA